MIKQRDVMHYGALEEFVTSACETVSGLLTVRHQGKLALGLRGRVSPGGVIGDDFPGTGIDPSVVTFLSAHSGALSEAAR